MDRRARSATPPGDSFAVPYGCAPMARRTRSFWRAVQRRIPAHKRQLQTVPFLRKLGRRQVPQHQPVCAAGSEHNGTHCIACASGRFKATHDAGRCNHTATSTLLCGLGTFQDGSLASTVSDAGCTQCPMGSTRTSSTNRRANSTTVPNIEVEVGQRTSFSTIRAQYGRAADDVGAAGLPHREAKTPASTTDDNSNKNIIGAFAGAAAVLLVVALVPGV